MRFNLLIAKIAKRHRHSIVILDCSIMGQPVSHMNVWAIGCVVKSTTEDLLLVLKKYEEGEKNPRINLYEIEESHFLTILEEIHTDPSDREIFIDYFRILDTRSRRIVNIREMLIALSPFVSKSIAEMFDFCFQLIDRKSTLLVDKPDVKLVLKLINQTCFYIGDKVLAHELIDDLVNSVYTSAGRIDGEIFYKDFVEYMTLHPIIQLFISLQFQGPITSKMLTDEQIEANVAQEQE